jgi:hypothetical protein
MPWCEDVDFLEGPLTEVNEFVWNRVFKLEKELPVGCDMTPELEQLYDFTEGPLGKTREHHHAARWNDCVAALEAIVTGLRASPLRAFTVMEQEAYIIGPIEAALINERNNNDPSQPFSPI